MVAGNYFCSVVHSCYEYLWSWGWFCFINGVCCYLVFNSCSVPYIGLYIVCHYMCHLCVVCLYWFYICGIFLMCIGVFLFSLFLWCSLYRLYSHMCVLCSVCVPNILNCCYYSWLPVYAFYVSCKMFDLFAIGILVDNPFISFGKCSFFRIYLFASGAFTMFCIMFRVRNATEILEALEEDQCPSEHIVCQWCGSEIKVLIQVACEMAYNIGINITIHSGLRSHTNDTAVFIRTESGVKKRFCSTGFILVYLRTR
jgi:hypothetical protein